MLSKFIKNIRAKPEPVRRGITLGVSLGFTGIVAFFWFVSFLNYSNEVLTSKPKVESPTSFLNKMSTLIGESYANIRSKIGDQSNSFVKSSSNNDAVTTATTTTNTTADSNDSAEVSASSSNSVFVATSSTSTENLTNSSQNSKSLGEILNTKK